MVSAPRTFYQVEVDMKNVFPDGVDPLLSEDPYRGHEKTKPLPTADMYEAINVFQEGKEEIPPEKLPPEGSEERARSFEENKRAALAKVAERRLQFHTRLKEWYQNLIQPIEEFLPKSPKDTVTFIPDGSMAALPFALFERLDGRYFIEDHAVLVAPSVKVISLLEQLRKQRSAVMSFGEPVIVGNPISKAGTLFTATSECQKVGTLLGLTEDHLILGQKATITHVLSVLEQAQRIHFSCHGSYSGKESLHSVYNGSLYFTPDKEHLEGELFAEMISKMKLEAELAFIAACYSGRGNTEYIHEGLIGLTRAFASSGVLTTVCNYWKLPDTLETVSMIETFYRCILGKDGPSLGKAAALQLAMCEAMGKSEEARKAPERWGGLFLTGLN